MNRGLRRRLLPGAAMAVCIVVLSTLALTSRLHTQDENEAAKWVEHTHIVIENLLLIGQDVATAETQTPPSTGPSTRAAIGSR